MVTVAEEEPFVAVVDEENLNIACSNCFALKSDFNQINLKKCGGCRAVYYCSKKCRNEDWKFHKDECHFIRKSDQRAAKLRLLSRFIMRVRRGDLPVAFNGRTYEDLMDHKDDIEKDVDSHDMVNKIYDGLVQFMGRDNAPTFEEFISFYGKQKTNTIGIMSSELDKIINPIGVGVYLGLSAHNHSCRPTADIYSNGSKIVLWANDPKAEYSKDLTLCYIPYKFTKEDRQKKLRSVYYFDCECDRCMDEETELLERSGRSDCCPIKGAVLPVENKQPLVCTNCGKACKITLEEINRINESIAFFCSIREASVLNDPTKAAVDNCMKTLDDAKMYLSPYNLYLLQFTCIVEEIYSSVYKDFSMVVIYDLAEKKALEKYSLFKTMQYIDHIITQLRAEFASAYKADTKKAFAKLDVSAKRAMDAFKKSKITEHPYYNVVTTVARICKNYSRRK